MISVSEFMKLLAERTRPDNTPVWDPVGLQLGDPASLVRTIGVCHEVTEEVVNEAESSPVDLLVTYHPLLFEPTTRILAGRSPGARSFRLVSAGVNLAVTHTDFDAAKGGTADSLADIFELREIDAFGGDPETGLPAIGRVGSFSGNLAAVEAIVSNTFGSSGLRISGDPNLEVERLAVVPGSGSSLIGEASRLANVLVTGDVSHHAAVAAGDAGLAIVDPGHVATERPGMAALVSLVGELSGLEPVDFTGHDPQTWV